MTAVAEMLLDIASKTGLLRYGTATAGSTTTLVDSTLEEPSGMFDGGTIWFLSGANAGKTARITTYVVDDDPVTPPTFTFPAQAQAIAAGVEYAALDARYTRDQLLGALNDALKELGPFDAKDETLVVVADQNEYDLPAGVEHVKRVQFSIETVAPFTWAPPDRWWREFDGTLTLSPHHPWDAGCAIRLWYEAQHARVSADADTITPDVHTQRIAWLAAWLAARNRLARSETSDPGTKLLAEEAKGMAMTLERQHPVRRIPIDDHWSDLP